MSLQKLEIFRLEDRVLFEAAAAAETVDAANQAETASAPQDAADAQDDAADSIPAVSGDTGNETQDASPTPDNAENTESDPQTADNTGNADESKEAAAPDLLEPNPEPAPEVPRHELVVLNASVQDAESLLNELGADCEVLRLDAGKDGMDQLLHYLNSSGTAYDAIHLITHGNDHSFTLGASEITSENFDSAEWAEVGTHLTQDGDVLLYGCDLAQSESGQALCEKIAAATDADLAASDDATGGADGDWDLEFTIGEVETPAISVADYAYSLTKYDLTIDPTYTALKDAFSGMTAGNEYYITFTSGGTLTFDSRITISTEISVNINGDVNGDGVIDVKMTNAVSATDTSGIFILSKANANLTLDYLDLSDNSTNAYNGGAILLSENANLTLDHCTVNHNVCNSAGGVIRVNKGNVTLSNSSFEGNTAKTQGGIVYFAGTQLTVDNCTFTGNSATSQGGVISSVSSAVLSITNSTFSNNTSNVYGGAIVSTNGSLTITDSIFTGNQAKGSNWVGGGAIAVSGGSFTLSGSTFTGNHTGEQGGAIHLAISASITDCDFTGNDSVKNGGAIHFDKGTSTLSGSVFNGNYTTGTSGNGGAITSYQAIVSVSNVLFTGNTSKVKGGAVYNEGGTYYLSEITAYGNDSTATGGAIYNGKTMYLIDSTIYNNHAGTTGGGIYNAGTMTLLNSISVGDTASGSTDGTDLYNADAGTLTVRYTVYGSGYGVTAHASNIADAAVEDVFLTDNGIVQKDANGLLLISDSKPASSSGTLIGRIGTTAYYLNTSDRFWYKVDDNTKSAYSYVHNPSLNYGLGSGSTTVVYSESANGVPKAELMDLDTIGMGAYQLDTGRIPMETPSLTVDITANIVDAYDNQTSLLEALDYARTLAAGGATELTISFAYNNMTFNITDFETITFAANTFLACSLTIQGNGIGNTIFNGGGTTTPGRIFLVNSGNTITLSGMTIQNAYLASSSNLSGGAVYNAGTLTLENVLFQNNSNASTGTTVGGGAIYNAGSLTISGTTFHQNTSGYGGGAILSNSTQTVSIVNSTFYNNHAGSGGMAILSLGTSPIQIIGSTFAGNTSTGGNCWGVIAVKSSTYLFNSIVIGGANSSGTASGGANLNCWTGANNGGKFYAYYSVVGASDALTTNVGTIVLSGTPAANHAAVFGANAYDTATGTLTPLVSGDYAASGTLLQYTGGKIHYLKNDVWTNSNVSVSTYVGERLTLDQKGISRTEPNGYYSPGAVSLHEFEEKSLVVSTADNVINPGDGVTSFAEALAYAKELKAGGATALEITFAGDFTFDVKSMGTITFAANEFSTCSLTIRGTGMGRTVFDGGNDYSTLATTGTRVFHINSGNDITLSDLTISGGYHAQSGSALWTAGGITINSVLFTRNYVEYGTTSGLAWYNSGGTVFVSETPTVVIQNSTFYENTSKISGSTGTGTVITIASAADVSFLNTTVYGNTGNYMFLTSTNAKLTIVNSTITENTCTYSVWIGANANCCLYGNVILGGSTASIGVNANPTSYRIANTVCTSITGNSGSYVTECKTGVSHAEVFGSNAFDATDTYTIAADTALPSNPAQNCGVIFQKSGETIQYKGALDGTIDESWTDTAISASLYDTLQLDQLGTLRSTDAPSAGAVAALTAPIEYAVTLNTGASSVTYTGAGQDTNGIMLTVNDLIYTVSSRDATTGKWTFTNSATNFIFTATVTYGDAVYAVKNAGIYTVTISNLQGTAKGNYIFHTPTDPATTTFTIEKAKLTVTATGVIDKVYNGANDVEAADQVLTASGIVSGDDATVFADWSYSDKNAGTGKTVFIQNLSLSGADCDNYELTATEITGVTGAIQQKVVTISGVTADDKEFDGTTDVTFDLSSAAISGLAGGDSVSLAVNGAFFSKNADVGKTVLISGYELSGTDAGNYRINFSGSQTATKATITPRQIFVTADHQEKEYADPDPELTYTYTGTFFGGDTITGKLARDPGEDSGDYNILQGSLTASSNYEIVYTGNTLTIKAPRPLEALSLITTVNYDWVSRYDSVYSLRETLLYAEGLLAGTYTIGQFDAASQANITVDGDGKVTGIKISFNLDSSLTVALDSELALTADQWNGIALTIDGANHDAVLTGNAVVKTQTTYAEAVAAGDASTAGTYRIFTAEDAAETPTAVWNLTLRNLTLLGGNSDGNGGAVSVIGAGGSSLTLDSVTISGTRSQLKGGAVSMTGSDFTLILNQAKLNENYASSSGGAVYLLGSGAVDLRISDSIFTGNESGASGGAILGKSDAATLSTTISGSTFTDNTAAADGGAIYLNATTSATHFISDSTFEGNSAGVYGGVIRLTGKSPVLKVESSVFLNNSAGIGGVLYSAVSTSNSVFLVNSTFYGNSATTNGGVVAFDHVLKTNNLYIIDSTITGNHAGSIGGAVYMFGGSWSECVQKVFVLNSIVYGNTNSGAAYDIHFNGYIGGTFSAYYSIIGTYFDKRTGSAFVPTLVSSYQYSDLSAMSDVFKTVVNDIAQLSEDGKTLAIKTTGLAANAGTHVAYDVDTGKITYLKSGTAVDFCTVTGLKADSFETALNGVSRTLTDIAYNMGSYALTPKVATATPSLIVTGTGEVNPFVEYSITSLRQTFEFAEGLLNGTYTIDQFDAASQANITMDGGNITGIKITFSNAIQTFYLSFGEITIAENLYSAATLTIQGNGEAATSVDAGLASRVLSIAAGNTVTISNLTLTHGCAATSGTVIYTAGDLTLRNVTVSNSRAAARDTNRNTADGTIYNATGTLTVIDSTFTGNTTYADYYDTVNEKGGAIYSAGGTLTVSGSVFSGNNAFRGGAIYASSASVSITDSTFSSNTICGYVQSEGSAIYAVGGTLNIGGSTFEGNSYTRDGARYGAIYRQGGTTTITDSSFLNNSARIGGAAVALNTGTLTIENSVFSGNKVSSGFGGAIFASGQVNSGTVYTYLHISDSLFSGNSATSGGAIAIGGNTTGVSGLHTAVSADLTNTTLLNNTATSQGGAIYSGTKAYCTVSLTVADSTLTGNTAGKTDADGNGGAIYNDSNTLYLLNSIATGNQIYTSGALADNDITSTVNYTMLHSVYGAVSDEAKILDNTTNLQETAVNIFAYDEDGNLIPDAATGAVKISGTGKAALNGVLTAKDGSTFYYKNTSGTWTQLDDPSNLVASMDADRIITAGQNGVSRIATDKGYNIGAYALPVDQGLTVTTVEDSANPFDGLISLREAVEYALTQSGEVAITFSQELAATMITLNSLLPEITGIHLSINGTVGESFVTVSGNNAYSLFRIASGAALNLSNLNLTAGYAAADGGAIRNAGNLTLNHVSVQTSTALGNGGAILNSGNLTIHISNFTGNTAGNGGAIDNNAGGVLVIDNSTFANNTVSGNGGAVRNNGTMTVSCSTFSENAIENTGILNVLNSTFHRAAPGDGITSSGTLNLANATLANCTVTVSGGTATVINSLLVSDTASDITLANTGGTVTLRNSGVSTTSGTINTTDVLSGRKASDFFGAAYTLADNGGYTQTIKFTTNDSGVYLKYALDSAGTITALSYSETSGGTYTDLYGTGADLKVLSDQRGLLYGGGTPSLGAYQGVVYIAWITSGASTTYYETISAAHTGANDGDTIYLAGGTIILNTATTLTKDITISGTDGLTVLDAKNLDGTQNVTNFFVIESGAIVTIKDLTLQNGSAAADGGAILNAGTLTVTDVQFKGNRSAAGNGGAIENSGTLTVIDSTFTGNSAANGSGGAIENSGTLTVIDSTFTGNSAQDNGGATLNSGTMLLIDSTLTGNNAASGTGGAVGSTGSTLKILNSILVGNTANGAAGDITAAASYTMLHSVYGIQSGSIADDSTNDSGAVSSGIFQYDNGQLVTDAATGAVAIRADGPAAYTGTLVTYSGSEICYSAEGTSFATVSGLSDSLFAAGQNGISRRAVDTAYNAGAYVLTTAGAKDAEVTTLTDWKSNPFTEKASLREIIAATAENGTVSYAAGFGTLTLTKGALELEKNLTFANGFELAGSSASDPLITVAAGKTATFNGIILNLGTLGGAGNYTFNGTTGGTAEMNHSGTVRYSSTGNQTVYAGNTGNLILTGSGTRTLAGNLSAADSIEIRGTGNNGLLTLSGGGYTITADADALDAEHAVINNTGFSALQRIASWNDTLKTNTVSGKGNTNLSIALTVGTITGSDLVYGSALAGTDLTYVYNIHGAVITSASTIGVITVNPATTLRPDVAYDGDGDIIAQAVSDAALLNFATASGTNYTITDQTITIRITPKSITLSGLTGKDKGYDGTTDAEIITSGAVFTGMESGDTLTAGATGHFISADVGINVQLLIDTITLGGASAGNYVLAAAGNQTETNADITGKTITVNWETEAAYTYNRTNQGGTVIASYLDVNGNKILLTVAFKDSGDHAADFFKADTYTATASGSDSNYILDNTVLNGLVMNRKEITITGSTAQDKVYDGDKNATITGAATGDFIAGDTVTINASGTFADKNAATDKDVAISYQLTGTDAANYLVNESTSVMSGTAEIAKMKATVSGAVAADKVYDSTTDVSLDHSSALLSANVISTDDVSIAGIAGEFISKNVNSSADVKITGLTLSGADAANYELDVLNQTGLTAEITQKTITITGSAAQNKVYDGNDTAAITGAATNDFFDIDDVTIGAAGKFTDKNVGQDKAVAITYLLTGADAANYLVDESTSVMNSTADITQKAITITGSTAQDKVYDGEKNATITGAATSDFIAGDTVTINASGTFADKNAATDKDVAISYQLTGTDAANYLVDESTSVMNGTADITQKAITINGSTAQNKVYDGNDTATVTGAATSDFITGDTVTINASGTFADKNAATDKDVAISYQLTGTDAANYLVDESTSVMNGTADISQKTIDITAASADDKMYDAVLAATVSGITADGTLSGDDVSISAAGEFIDKNVGRDKAVAITYQLSGADAGNYKFGTKIESGTADITPREITISGITAADKEYDGTTSAVVDTSSAVFNGLIGGESLTIQVDGVFANKNAGTGKAVNLSGWVLGGADVDNYVLKASGQQTSATAAITARAVTVTADDQTIKQYDPLPEFTYTITGGTLVDGETLAGSLTTDYVQGTGDFLIRQGSVDSAHNGNYSISFMEGTLTVAAAPKPPTPDPTPSPAPAHNGTIEDSDNTAVTVTLSQNAFGKPNSRNEVINGMYYGELVAEEGKETLDTLRKSTPFELPRVSVIEDFQNHLKVLDRQGGLHAPEAVIRIDSVFQWMTPERISTSVSQGVFGGTRIHSPRHFIDGKELLFFPLENENPFLESNRPDPAMLHSRDIPGIDRDAAVLMEDLNFPQAAEIPEKHQSFKNDYELLLDEMIAG